MDRRTEYDCGLFIIKYMSETVQIGAVSTRLVSDSYHVRDIKNCSHQNSPDG